MPLLQGQLTVALLSRREVFVIIYPLLGFTMSHSMPLPFDLNLQRVTAFVQASLASCIDRFSVLLAYCLDGSDLITSTPALLSYIFTAFLLVLAAFNHESINENTLLLCIAFASRLCTKKLIELAAKPPNNAAGNEESMDKIRLGYARVSSREQAEDTHALEQQIARLEADGAERILFDVEKGKKDDRVNYQKAMALIEAGKVHTLVITRVDRITRSFITLRKIVATLQQFDVNLVVIDQKMDLSTPQGKLMLNMLGIMSEWEVDLLADRVKRGKEHQRKENRASGSCPFGYIVVDHQYVLDTTPFLCLLTDRPDNYLDLYADEFDKQEKCLLLPHRTVAEICRDCIEIFFEARGITPTLQKVFEKYGVQKTQAKRTGTDKILHWTKRGFSLWAKNPILDGHTPYDTREISADGKRRLKPQEEWYIRLHTHPDQRLLKDGEAEEIRLTFAANAEMGCGAFGGRHRREEYRPYAYQIGLVYCGECGSRCTQKKVYTPSKHYAYFGCRHSGCGCSNAINVKQPDIEKALIAVLVERSQQLGTGVQTVTDPTTFKSERLHKLETQLAFLEEFPGFNPETEGFKAKLRRQIEEETNLFQSKHLEDKTLEEIIRAGNNPGIWEALTSNEKVRVYRRIVHRIFIRNGRVESVVLKDKSLDSENE